MPMVRVSNGGSKVEKIPFTFNVGPNGTGQISVTFSESFGVAPNVAMNITNATISAIALWASDVTTSGYTLHFRNANSYNYTVVGYTLAAQL